MPQLYLLHYYIACVRPFLCEIRQYFYLFWIKQKFCTAHIGKLNGSVFLFCSRRCFQRRRSRNYELVYLRRTLVVSQTQVCSPFWIWPQTYLAPHPHNCATKNKNKCGRKVAAKWLQSGCKVTAKWLKVLLNRHPYTRYDWWSQGACSFCTKNLIAPEVVCFLLKVATNDFGFFGTEWLHAGRGETAAWGTKT